MKFQLTDLGKLMDAQLVAGSKPIITRIEGGDTFSAVPESLLSVQKKKQDLQVEDIAVVEGKSHLYFLLTNIEVQNEYYLRQIGIYAKPSEDADEILYIIGQDKSGERVPAISEKEVKFDYDLVITVDNSYEVTVNVNSNDFARKKMVLELDDRKVDTDGGDVSNTISQVQQPASGEKYPVFKAGKLKELLGNCVRWLNSLKEDKVDQTAFDSHNHDDRYYTEDEVNKSLDKKVTASGGDISNTKLTTFTASTASYPVPAAGDTVKIGFGKIKKFFEDIRNWMSGVCLLGSIVNNCVTNRADLPLSAAQGKVLMDLYTVLNTKSQSFNTEFYNRGYIYRMTLSKATPTDTSEILLGTMDVPEGTYLFVLNSIARSNSETYAELFARQNGAAFLQGRIPNTNGTHTNLCMNTALWLPKSTIAFSLQRQDTTGNIVFFGGELIAVRLK